jgi:hypothetical protein
MASRGHQGVFLLSSRRAAVELPHFQKPFGVSSASYLSAYELSTFM